MFNNSQENGRAGQRCKVNKHLIIAGHIIGASLYQFRSQLLAWYEARARELPWRKNRDPYRVWLSEIMLQQTRVAAVVEHYHEFQRRFPDVKKLSAAREASVLAAWSGLGYYRRARMLHAAARIVAQKHGGKFPRTAQELRMLPGIGRYTAAAIASIAFGEPVAVVDGNVERVIQRITGNPLRGEKLWTEANGWLDRQRPGDFNQAMMELGAVVCTPRAPACLTCPVVHLCATRGELATGKKAAPRKKREAHYALNYRTNGRGCEVFLKRRSIQSSLMAGMWELPEIDDLSQVRSGGNAEPCLTVRHSITVTDYTVRVWRTSAPRSKGKWIPVEGLNNMALTGLARKILRKAGVIP